MEKQKKVIDASVILKWFSKEIDSDKALKLKESHLSKEFILITPEFLILEIMNALRYKKIDEPNLFKANKALWEIQLHVEHTNSFLLEKTISLSLKHNLSIYDAVYAALAQLHGCQLVTVDEKLSKLPQAKLL